MKSFKQFETGQSRYHPKRASLLTLSLRFAGDQSVGKSSVLEAISGIDLPRGQSLTTRCPLVIEMRHVGDSSSATNNMTGWIEGEEVGVTQLSPSKINDWIQASTKKIAGGKANIVEKALHVRVEGPGVPSLTLVDLPGIARAPTQDQPANIEEITVSLIRNTIKHDDCIILAVMPANVDFANCACIKLAREVDPRGERSLGVVTKIDLCELGILDKLRGEFSFKLGLIPVRNRSPVSEITWRLSVTPSQ